MQLRRLRVPSGLGLWILLLLLLPGVAAATCTASLVCSNGSTISCSGSSSSTSCSSTLAGYGSVTCDNVTTRCPTHMFTCPETTSCDTDSACFQWCKSHKPPGTSLTNAYCDPFYLCCTCSWTP